MSKSDEPFERRGGAPSVLQWRGSTPIWFRNGISTSILADVFNTDLRGRPRTMEREKPSSVPTDRGK